MKKLMIFAAQECCTGMSEVSLLNSLFTVEQVAADADTVAAAAAEKGYETYLYYLHDNAHLASKRNVRNHVRLCRCLDDKTFPEAMRSCDAAVLLGIPAMQGTLDSFCDRNYGNMWFDCRINGEKVGQMGMIKLLLATYGVPVVAVMSDEMGVAEAKTLFPCARTIVSSTGSYIFSGGWQCCLPRPVAEVRDELTSAVSEALSSALPAPDDAPDFPANMEVEYMRTDFCDVACSMNPQIERKDARTVTWKIDKPRTLNDMSLKGEE